MSRIPVDRPRPGRPYLFRREVDAICSKWIVATAEEGIVTTRATLPEAHDLAAAWAVWRGAERAERRGVGS